MSVLLSDENNSQVKFKLALLTLATLHYTTLSMSDLLSDDNNSQVQLELTLLNLATLHYTTLSMSDLLSDDNNSQVQFKLTLLTLATLHNTTLSMSVLLSDENNSQVSSVPGQNVAASRRPGASTAITNTVFPSFTASARLWNLVRLITHISTREILSH
uniref:Uncharacterized protein n=1 Tax=Timema shepardi TaxID=629360 RepID=A0A7R9ATC9_TIMSH|nr:unnamed protein product [Timema shepardi]